MDALMSFGLDNVLPVELTSGKCYVDASVVGS